MFKKRGIPKEYGKFFTKHKLWMASATLMGTVIGAGVLGIPYVVAQSGLFLGIVNIVVIGIALLILHLCLGEITLRTKKIHQLTGYIEQYSGKTGKYFMIFSMTVGIYGALIAYIIGEGEILKTIFGGNALIYSLLFFILASFIIYRGIKTTGRTDMILIALMVLAIITIGILSYNNIEPSNLTQLNWKNIFIPYGVVLFAFVGTAAIPELREELDKNKKQLKKAIIIGSIAPIIIYIIFAIIVVGIVGLNQFEMLAPNERIATIALGIFADRYLLIAANIFAAMAMFTSFIGLGLALKQMYEYDLHFSKKISYGLTLFPPMLIAVTGLTQFIRVLDFSGAVAGGVDGILIMLAYWTAKKQGNRKPEYSLNIGKTTTAILIIIFAAGIAYQLWRTFV